VDGDADAGNVRLAAANVRRANNDADCNSVGKSYTCCLEGNNAELL